MITINNQLCERCGTCIGVCPVDAVILTRYEITINSGKCIECFSCVDVCPVDALSKETFALQENPDK